MFNINSIYPTFCYLNWYIDKYIFTILSKYSTQSGNLIRAVTFLHHKILRITVIFIFWVVKLWYSLFSASEKGVNKKFQLLYKFDAPKTLVNEFSKICVFICHSEEVSLWVEILSMFTITLCITTNNWWSSSFSMNLLYPRYPTEIKF